jgi:SAM-dependent methyltransferase
VEAEIVSRLLALNRLFYQTMGKEFSATRMRLQPGVHRVLETIPTEARILDLGCGNGELASELARRNFSGVYIGMDFSPVLLQYARDRIPYIGRNTTPVFRFLEFDLARDHWDEPIDEILPAPGQASFDLILAFAVLHHLPGYQVRLQVLRKVRQLIAPSGNFIHSEWQFLNSPRLQARIQPWERAGLVSAQVDPGDYLLDWRRGGTALRYVHHFTTQELSELAAQSGFSISHTFLSDGQGGKLGLYQWWSPCSEFTADITDS